MHGVLLVMRIRIVREASEWTYIIYHINIHVVLWVFVLMSFSLECVWIRITSVVAHFEYFLQ